MRSHAYNAWLAQLIERGQAPGLWIAHQWSNVLFDQLLSTLAKYVVLQGAERVATAISVLVFFWGGFAFVSALAGRWAWFLTPILAAISYGWTLQEGLMNYYLSVGLAFVGLAVFLRGQAWRWIVLAALVPLTYLGHPLGTAWMLGAAAYLGIANATPRRFRPLLVCSAIAILFLLRFELYSRYQAEGSSTSFLYDLSFYNGLDQLVLAKRYILPAAVLGAFLVAAIVAEAVRRKSFLGVLADAALSLELYVIMQAAILLLPNSIRLAQYPASLSALTTRSTIISAILLCSLLAVIPPQRLHAVVSLGIAAIFFLFLHQDTAVLSSIEAQAGRLVHNVPEGGRVISTLGAPSKYRFSLKHMADVPCIGHCFSYGNYEPPSGQFRVRASPGSAYVVNDIHDVTFIEEGHYVVQPKDVPLYQLYQCNARWTDLCIRPLEAGETNIHFGDSCGQPTQTPSPANALSPH